MTPPIPAALGGTRLAGPGRDAVWTLASLGVALAAAGVLMRFAGLDPLAAYRELGRGGFGSARNAAETLLRFCPLALCSLAVTTGFRAAFFTIGVEGQFYLGALASTVAALALRGAPPLFLLPAAMAAGAAAGSAWGLVAGLLKVRLGVNEVIGTLMLNYVAVLLVDYLVRGPLRDAGSEMQYSAEIPAAAAIPRIVSWARLSWGILVPPSAACLVWLFLERSWAGFRAQAHGSNPTAARFAGIDGARSLLFATGVSGALGGLAGALVIQGETHRLQAGVGSDYGYTAIPIALVGQTSPAGSLLAALLFAGMDVGATMMQLKASVPLPAVKLLEGLMILAVVSGRMLRPRLTPAGPTARNPEPPRQPAPP